MTEITRANIADLEELSLLFDAYRVFYGKATDLEGAAFFLSERIIKEESVIYIARTKGIMVGFTQLYPLFSSTNMNRIWLLNDLYLHPDYRGLKISNLLLDRAKQLALETKVIGISLETARTNIPGNALYPKAGFKLDEDNNYYFWSV